MGSRLVRALLVVLAAATATIAGCNLIAARLEDDSEVRMLRDAARSLVPPGARIVQEKEGYCTELSWGADCFEIHFFLRGHDLDRARAVHELLQAGGWEGAPDGPWLSHRRDGLSVIGRIVRRDDGWRRDCAGPRFDPSDHYDRERCLDRVLVRLS